VDKGQGRLETRRYWQIEDIAWFVRAVRGHWALENQCH
jgi:hypothetical protein